MGRKKIIWMPMGLVFGKGSEKGSERVKYFFSLLVIVGTTPQKDSRLILE